MLKQILLAGLVVMTGRQAEAACSLVKVAELHVTVENNQILIPGELEGKKVKFLFDTGFPGSVITSNAARQLEMSVSPMTQAFFDRRLGVVFSREDNGFGHVGKFFLDGNPIESTSFGIFAPNDNFGAPDVLAVLGSDFWGGYDVEIDLPHHLITLLHVKDCEGYSLAYWGNDYNVSDLEESGRRTEINIKLNGHDATAILDSGSRYSTITERAASRVGMQRGNAPLLIEERPQNAQPTDLLSLLRFSHGLGLYTMQPPNIRSNGLPEIKPESGLPTYWLARFDKMQIDAETVSPMGFRVVKTPVPMAPHGDTRIPERFNEYDILLGVDFLQSHRLLISKTQGKVYFTYVGGTDFAKPR